MLVQIFHQVVQMWNSIVANPMLCIVYLFVVFFLAMPLVVVYFAVAIFDMITGNETDPLMVQRSIINALLITIGILYIPALGSMINEAGLAATIIMHIILIPIVIIHSELIDNAHKNIFDKFRRH